MKLAVKVLNRTMETPLNFYRRIGVSPGLYNRFGPLAVVNCYPPKHLPLTQLYPANRACFRRYSIPCHIRNYLRAKYETSQ